MEISISLDPAIAANELEKYLEELNALKNISIHCDMMRPDYVERYAVDPHQYEYIMHNTEHPIDVHIMSTDPYDTLAYTRMFPPMFTEAHKSKFNLVSSTSSPRSICVHVETGNAFEQDILAEGLAIDLQTPIESIDKELLSKCKTITIMSVKAGKSGQSFNPAALEKVKQVKFINPNAQIIMDGGINDKNIASIKKAGVNVAVVGSYMFEAKDRAKALQKLLRQ